MKLPKRIHILGPSGSGKTTISRFLSKKLKIRAYDLDDVMFEIKYSKIRNKKERIKLLRKIVGEKEWIIEGVYSTWIEDSIKRSDLVIWIDLPITVLFYRVFKRFAYEKYVLKSPKNSWKSLMGILRYVRNYKHTRYYDHEGIINKHKVKFVYLRNRKEVEDFIKNFK